MHKNNSNNYIIKNGKKQIKKINLNKNKIKNSLSDIIKHIGSSHRKRKKLKIKEVKIKTIIMITKNPKKLHFVL